MIKDTIHVSRYTPPPQSDASADPEAPWILLGGTPSTCSNIAIHNLYPNKVDLVVSGPNYGRNTSSAFALSSGTVGAALTASMAGVPAIALSYGVFQRPVEDRILAKANEIACTVIQKMCRPGRSRGGWSTGLTHCPRTGETVFAEGGNAADVYNVNIPLVPEILEQDSAAPRVAWTTLATRKYGRIFVPLPSEASGPPRPTTEAEKADQEAGPAAVPVQSASAADSQGAAPSPDIPAAFAFKPDMGSLVNPDMGTLEEGTDLHAIHHAITSITPITASFARAEPSSRIETTEGNGKGLWKL